MPQVTDLEFFPLDVPLREPFGIATGAQLVARNVLVRITLSDGSEGLGEAAPFPAVNGETQSQVLGALPAAREALMGKPASRYRYLADICREALSAVPSARAGVEIALLDALTRRAGLSLFQFFGGKRTSLLTDITLPTGDVERAAEAARRARQQGFESLKIKVGGAPLELDVARVQAAHVEAPRAKLILDANASFSAEQALTLLDALNDARAQIVLFEQPTGADDLGGLREVQSRGNVPVAADESARSCADVARLFAERAVAAVNIKATKCGLIEAWDMTLAARALGLRLMIGGMVETELAMTASACLAGGVGGFEFVDLDTPLFMAERPLTGGFRQNGPELELSDLGVGHGVAYLRW